MNHSKAVIFGCKGSNLKSDESAFFSETKPVGFILFSRNCINPMQLKKLINVNEVKMIKKAEDWLNEYGESHQNPINKMITNINISNKTKTPFPDKIKS